MAGTKGKGAGKNERVEKAYDFFKECATTKTEFSIGDLVARTGWAARSATTYISKQWKDLLEPRGPKRHRVKAEFLRLSRGEFLSHITQKRPIYTGYLRKKHEQLVTYEFLLPLTREDALRKSLDDLFYADTIERRLCEIEPSDLAAVFGKELLETDTQVVTRVRDFVASKISGYSISHVSGRFRAGSLIARAEVGKLLEEEGRYLVDETTAVVRFVIPCETGAMKYESSFASIRAALTNVEPCATKPLDEELERIRVVFFQLFVEAVVRTVKGEDQIWLIEEASAHRRLYVWEKVAG